MVDVAVLLGQLAVEALPVNFLVPIPGTPLEGARRLNPRYCLKALALFRLTNPKTELRIAGGREENLGPLQPLGLYAANSIFVGDYLTTRGQSADEDFRMIEALGFEPVLEGVSRSISRATPVAGSCPMAVPGEHAMTDSPTRNVTELIHRAREGDLLCREELFTLCRGYLGYVARAQVESWLRVKVDASDVVQQTMMEAHRDFDRFAGKSEQEWLGWLRKILSHNVADFVRAYRGTSKRRAGREVRFRDAAETGLTGMTGGARAGGGRSDAQPGGPSPGKRAPRRRGAGRDAAGLPGGDRVAEFRAAAVWRGGRTDGPLPSRRADALDAGAAKTSRGAGRRVDPHDRARGRTRAVSSLGRLSPAAARRGAAGPRGAVARASGAGLRAGVSRRAR